MSGKLKINFYNASFERVSDEMHIRLEHTVLNQVYEVRKHIPTGGITLKDIDTSQGGRYVLKVNPDRYRSMIRIIRILDEPQKNEEHVILAVRPDRVIDVQFPDYASLSSDMVRVLEQSNVETLPGLRGQALYDALRPLRLPPAGLFNIHAKMNATLFQNHQTVFSYMEQLTRIRGDRFFAFVKKTLRDEVKNACLEDKFHEVSGSLHTPPPNFQLLDSFKSTGESYGNLQLTFFANPGTLEFMVDADIDDAAGISHIFQVVEHALSGSETHPYDIHQILTYHQKIDPGYNLII